MIIDLNVPALGKDGAPRNPQTTLEAARRAGLQGLLLVGAPDALDRDAWATAADELEGAPALFFGLVLEGRRGRFVCIPPQADANPFPRSWFSADGEALGDKLLLQRANETGCAVIVSQPYVRQSDEDSPAGDMVFAFPGIHALEVRTAETDAMSGDIALESGMGMRIGCVAGTGDAPEAAFGEHAALLPGEITTQAELVAALRSGPAWPVALEPVGRKKRSKRRRKKRKGEGEGEGETEASAAE